jgi:hypothetical protein
MAAVWGGLLPCRRHLFPPSGNLRLISAVHNEVETVELIRSSTCQHEGTAASTTRGNPGNCAGFFFTHARDVRSNSVNGRNARPEVPPYV